MRRKPNCDFDLYFVKHVLEFLILIYVLYKNGVNLNSYGLWSYSDVLICLSMDKWALCGHFYVYMDPVWSLYNIGIGCHLIAQVVFWVELPVQRRLCPIFVKSWVSGKRDSMVRCRVTRHPRIFHKLTGCQWSPRICGVTGERLGDIFIKALSGDRVSYLCNKLGMINIYAPT